MKKFEEKLRTLKEKTLKLDRSPGIRFWYDLSTLVNTFRDWVSPEDHQKVVDDLTNARSSITNLMAQLDYYKKDKRFEAMAEEILSLKSQLEKQQPEIPEFVAKAVEEFKKQPDSYKGFSNVNEVWSWLNEYQMNNDDFGICGLNNKFFVLAHFAINGYTVAKEKRFYLKNKLTGLYLYECKKGFFEQENIALELTSRCDYTQQEIDSMETGSYEQILVEEN
ncbi:DUF1642 domain-containing protein [Lactococcus formosensis]|uniref:DUF1642 domain-containing protein n=1 Tax=Lactococcus formosensis TaxID=1281486 RepID=UPI0024358719|nr:DUF1642 domain-containing protein [Lactococcus formosensis]MDG6154922.1 DUF1642 domain-containing protein [Lactococcus formosensis]